MSVIQSEVSGTKIKKSEKNSVFSGVLIKLLQGFIYTEDKRYWEALLNYQESIRDYFFQLGLQLRLSMDDGYAFLSPFGNGENHSSDEENEDSSSQDHEDSDTLPSLIRKIPLSFEVSLLCVLLREALEQFDSRVSDDHRLILHRNDIYELLRTFYEEKTDETKQVRRFDTLINKVSELGFLKQLRGNSDSFEVRRVIKALIDAEQLASILKKMKSEVSADEIEEAVSEEVR